MWKLLTESCCCDVCLVTTATLIGQHSTGPSTACSDHDHSYREFHMSGGRHKQSIAAAGTHDVIQTQRLVATGMGLYFCDELLVFL